MNFFLNFLNFYYLQSKIYCKAKKKFKKFLDFFHEFKKVPGFFSWKKSSKNPWVIFVNDH